MMPKHDETLEEERDRTSRRSIKIPIEVVPELVGNAAAMREALEEIRVEAMSDYEPDADYLIEKCNAALSAPARNCDRCKTGEEARCRFLQIAELPEGNGDADMREWYRKLIAWLFEPAKEGGSDVRE